MSEARRAAARVDDPKARAWALRDGLDGLRDALTRRLDARPSLGTARAR